jgi:hypothetical protein
MPQRADSGEIMSHIVECKVPVEIRMKADLISAFKTLAAKGIASKETNYGYDVAIPGCNMEDVTSRLRADKEARLQLHWNDAKGQYVIMGESYRIHQQYDATVQALCVAYQQAAMQAAMEAVYPMVYAEATADGGVHLSAAPVGY